MKKRITLITSIGLLLCLTEVKGQSTYLSIPDTRDVATTPADYKRILKSEFKRGSAIGLPTTTYFYTLGLRGWNDDSGGPAHELAFGANKLYFRSGTTAAGWATWRQVLVTNNSGFVGIGTDAPNEMLSVNGNIRAHQIKVESTASTWPDYVFKNDYQVPTLVETEKFIKENGHLPEVPKAETVEKEGYSLNEMDKILLKKVEEITLHLIKKDKEIIKQQDEIDNLKSIVEQMQTKIKMKK